MLKRVGGQEDVTGAKVKIAEALFPAPFREGLEYSSPARGNWNIVHTGMLIPQSHQIFVCAEGCLRGVVLTAAEMNAMDRYSSILIKEENVLDGTMEDLMIEGVTDILQKLTYRPRAILLFISCQHFFLAYDQNLVFETLRKRFPDIKFLDCYMIPTLRKSGLTPDQKMRLQMFRLLESKPKKHNRINFIGSNLPVSKSCEWVTMLDKNGWKLQMLNWCQTFDEYMDMACASLNIIYEPMAIPAAEELKVRLRQDYIYLPFVFREEQLEKNYQMMTDRLQMEKADFSKQKQEALEALKRAKELIGDTKIALDYSFTFRILNFARMLLEHGFHVTEIFGDSFLIEEKEDFEWIRAHHPDIMIVSCIRPKMRVLKREREETILAIGQKAAYFTGTDHFVNVVESGGLYGYDGIRQIAELMEDAYLNKKDRRAIIQRKGYGCESCI